MKYLKTYEEKKKGRDVVYTLKTKAKSSEDVEAYIASSKYNL